MSDFDKAVGVILWHEGGFKDGSDGDLGGATNFGISLAYARSELGLTVDVDHDGDVDAEDIRKLTVDDAKRIYREQWWDRYRYGRITSQIIATKVFDMAVNMGAKQGHKLLQRALNKLGNHLDEDGTLGPLTIGAANDADTDALIDMLVAVQQAFYYSLAQRNPKFYTWLHDWLVRAQWPIEGRAAARRTVS